MNTSKAAKIQALISHGSTPGERQAASHALARLTRSSYPNYAPGSLITLFA